MSSLCVASATNVSRLPLRTGEPKSGTTFMYHWAHGALIRTCNFLNEWFGGTSCQLKTGTSRGMFHTPPKVSIIFDARLSGDDAKCSCDGVDRCEFAARSPTPDAMPTSFGLMSAFGTTRFVCLG